MEQKASMQEAPNFPINRFQVESLIQKSAGVPKPENQNQSNKLGEWIQAEANQETGRVQNWRNLTRKNSGWKVAPEKEHTTWQIESVAGAALIGSDTGKIKVKKITQRIQNAACLYSYCILQLFYPLLFSYVRRSGLPFNCPQTLRQ